MPTQPDFENAVEKFFTDPANVDLVKAALGGSSPVVESDWVTIGNAAILTLPTTPVEIVAAPGAGFMLKFWGAELIVDTTTQPYGNIDAAANMSFQLHNGARVSTILNEASDFYIGDTFLAEGVYKVYFTAADPPVRDFLSSFENAALDFRINNGGSGNLTGGDPANSARIKAFYSIVATE
jgi:hypothetical protein